MNKNSKIYVAGHTGLVGSAIMRCLKARGYENIITKSSSELDLINQSAVDAFFSAEKPEYVFLAAAKVGGILANSTYPADFIYQNIMIGTNVVHAAYKYGVTKLLNLGSSCIYPRLAPQPMKEEHLLTSELEPTNEAYAIAKIAIIKLCRYYNQQYGTNFISVMPTNQYGENDNFDMETAHALPMLMVRAVQASVTLDPLMASVRAARAISHAEAASASKIAPAYQSTGSEAISAGAASTSTSQAQSAYQSTGSEAENGSNVTLASLVVWGDGSAYREFMHSDDLADACVYLMENKDYADIGEFVNITSGTDIQMKDLVEMIRKIVGFEGTIEYDTTKPNGTPRKLMDATKIQSLGWKPKISLEDGIRMFYKWYITR
ncbi:hypothetical protein FACS1894122_00670 [Alphaproteobacteria bacterium]|nr:hypothetical protein FACS1894122_00670 [Alphaproteobacteria bacterium]